VKVLLTGGAGFLGKNVVTALLRADHEVTLLVRGGRRPGLPESVNVVDGDVRDAEVFKSASQGCDAIIHTAAMVKIWSPRLMDFDDINVGGLKNAIAAARAQGIRLVYTSSFFAIGPTGTNRRTSRRNTRATTATTTSARRPSPTAWLVSTPAKAATS
jgi:nucleoside-diphosphate-sugar epimerase